MLVLLASAGTFGFVTIATQRADAQPFDAPVFAEPGNWVESQPLPEATSPVPDGTANGLYYLLSDMQYRTDGSAQQEYVHIAYKVIDRAGLEEAGRLTFEFDPSDTRLTVHSVRIHRDGTVSNRLDPDRFQTVRREPDLSSGIVDGNLTSFVELADVRVGDIVEYAVSYATYSELWPGGLSLRLSTQWSIPLEQHHLRVLVPTGSPFSIAGSSSLEPQVREQGGWTEYTWQQSRPQRVPGETNVPGHHSTWQFLSLSTMSSWAEVVAWALPLYDPQTALPPDAASFLDGVRANHSERRDLITAVIRYVQDDIRYVSDSTGLGSHVPRSPATVIESGYGDCKDKSFLLVMLLRAIGVEASIALTDIDRGGELPLLAPTPFAFDHAVVRIDRGSQPAVWVDATSSHQGGRYPILAAPAYQFALPVLPNQTGLEEIAITGPQQPYIEVHERFDMANLDVDGVSLDVTTLYRRREADAFRASLAGQSRASLGERYLRYYRSHYPGIEPTTEIQVDDDRDANVLSVSESYRLSPEAYHTDDLLRAFPVRGDMVLNQLEAIDPQGRQSPVHVPWPIYQKHVHDIVNAPIPLSGLPEVDLDEPFARYWTQVVGGPDSVHLEYTLRTKASQAGAEDAAAYDRIADAIGDTADLWINFDFESGFWVALSHWFSDPQNSALFGWSTFAGLYLLATIGAILAFRRDQHMPDGAVLYPVNAGKFFLMSVATFNLYGALWMWRNWAWLKQRDDRHISAFVRAWFSFLFFPGLAMEIQEISNPNGRLARALAMGLALIFSALVVGTMIADQIVSHSLVWGEKVQGLIMLAGVAEPLVLLPFVLKINALNREKPEVQRFNSRFTAGTITMLIYGLVFMVLALIGYFA